MPDTAPQETTAQGSSDRSGPLVGLKVVELAGIGPGPFAAMLLADLGADVIRVDRQADSGLGVPRGAEYDLMNRSRRSIAVDLKNPQGVDAVLKLAEQADVLIDPFRPGVTEKLGLGPDEALARNSRLIYARMTGFGNHGPLAHAAGHDINYIALSGALHAIGTKEGPVPPLNMIGDFGGGGMYLAFGVMAAVYEAQRSGVGQVVDIGMVDGAISLMTPIYGLQASGYWHDARGENILDGAAPFYGAFETADGKFVSIGSIEKKFYAILLEKLGLDPAALPDQMDRDRWPELKAVIAETIKTKTRDQWVEIMEGTDVCFAPVLSLAEAPHHPHNRARANFVEIAGINQPAPAPRFSRTPGRVHSPPAMPGEHTEAALADWGFTEAEVSALKDAAAIGRKNG
ncbi:MAG: CaiB/BaiF CoA-transferase family protein [Alphaproteobacteria bacterium]|nr:CaiB/BaiF CoA-transferase family protein [Alphaproteobacteria bacterium]